MGNAKKNSYLTGYSVAMTSFIMLTNKEEHVTHLEYLDDFTIITQYLSYLNDAKAPLSYPCQHRLTELVSKRVIL